MIGVFLLAWVVFPALMLVLCAGAGLGVRRAAGPVAVPAVLVVPVGLALLVVVGGLFCYYAALAPLAAPAFVFVGVLGLVLSRGSLRRLFERRGRGTDLWAVGAAVGAWAIVAAPVVLSGKPGFTGYGHIVDISYQFDLAAHFAHSGRSIPAISPGSAYLNDLVKYLSTGYPGGGQWTLGALSNLMPVDLSWLYQPFLAFLSAMSALSLYSLLGRLIRPRGWRALGAFIAAQPNILMASALAGGIKELSTSCFLLLLAALIAPVLPRVVPGRTMLAIPIALAATFASLSLTTVPWIGVLGAGVAVTVLVFQRRRLLAAAACAQIAVMAFVLSLPTLGASSKLLPLATGPGLLELGDLIGARPGDHRRRRLDRRRLPLSSGRASSSERRACGSRADPCRLRADLRFSAEGLERGLAGNRGCSHALLRRPSLRPVDSVQGRLRELPVCAAAGVRRRGRR